MIIAIMATSTTSARIIDTVISPLPFLPSSSDGVLRQPFAPPNTEGASEYQRRLLHPN